MFFFGKNKGAFISHLYQNNNATSLLIVRVNIHTSSSVVLSVVLVTLSTHGLYPARGKGALLKRVLRKIVFLRSFLWTSPLFVVVVSNDFDDFTTLASSSSGSTRNTKRIRKSFFVQYHNHVVVRKIEREHQNHDE